MDDDLKRLIESGGTAFPVEMSLAFGGTFVSPGMSLRDYFAGQAMASLAGTILNDAKDAGHDGVKAFGMVSELSYLMADRMLTARLTPGGEA